MRAGNRIGILLLISKVSTVEHGPINDFLRDALESFKITSNNYNDNIEKEEEGLASKKLLCLVEFSIYFSSVVFLLKLIVTADVICTQGFKRY